MSIESIFGVILIAIGIAMAFAKVDPDEIKILKYFSPMASLHQYPWWRYGMSGLIILFGLFLLVTQG